MDGTDPVADPGIVFISYRRDDTRPTSGRLYDLLATTFGADRAFLDVTLAPGTRYPERLRAHVDRAVVMLAVVGPNWAGTDASGQHRLDNPDDWVRREVEAALGNDVPLVPVLVDEARMPPPGELPPSIRPLATLNALILLNDHWGMTSGNLLETISGLTGWPQRGAREQHLFGTPPMIVKDIRRRPELEAVLSDGPKAITALHGIGGVGKSQLAAVAFEELRGEYDHAAWIDMRQAEGRVAYERIAQALELDLSGDAVETVRNHITASPDAWLLVYDNADSPRQIEPLLPRGGHVKIVITSRYRSWAHIAEHVDLDVFPLDVAVEHLCGTAGRPVDEHATALAEDLGRLPLALSLAGAFCAERRVGFDRYRTEILPADLIGSLSPLEGGGYDKTIEALWRESLRCIGEISAEAVELIGLLSLLDWTRVERSWLADRYDPESSSLDRLLALLSSYSLVDLDEVAVAIKHNLLADGIASDLTEIDLAPQLERLFSGSLDELGADLDASAAASESIRHLQRLLYDHPDRLSPEMVDYLYMASEQLLHEEVPSVEFHRATVVAGERLLGPDHLDALMLRSNLAMALWHAGQYDEAVEQADATYARCRSVLGPDAEETLTAGSVLGAVFSAVGRPDDAAQLERNVLAGRERVLGREHPDTINARANLASTYSELGRYDEALELGEQVLAERVRLLGDRHPDTLTSRANLAATYSDLSRYAEARRLEEDVLADRLEVLGPTHPETLHLRANIALSCRHMGELDEAATILEDVSTTQRALLGPDHPETLKNLGSLALVYSENGRLDEAIALNETVERALEEQLGDEHHEVLIVRSNRALMLSSAGRLDEAIGLVEEVAERWHHTFGATNPETLSARSNLGSMYLELGRVEDAIAIEEETCELQMEALGADHHETLVTRSNLATSYARAGRQEEALDIGREVLDGLTRLLGPDHADTARVRDLCDTICSGGT